MLAYFNYKNIHSASHLIKKTSVTPVVIYLSTTDDNTEIRKLYLVYHCYYMPSRRIDSRHRYTLGCNNQR